MGWRRTLRRLRGGQSRVGVYVDGPNVLRSEFSVDLDDIRNRALSYGPVSELQLYLDANAPTELIQAAEARGFAVTVTSGDVDVRLATDATAAVSAGTIGILVIASRDMDFKPVIEYARKKDVHTVALVPGEHGRSDALTNAADEFAYVDERG